MKNKKNSWFGVLMLALAVLLLILAAGCDEDRPSPVVNKANITSINVYGTSLNTVDHDGHRFIVCVADFHGTGVSIIHHPSCPCVNLK